jgi:hypothetical protein
LGLLAQSADRDTLYRLASELVRNKVFKATGCKE